MKHLKSLLLPTLTLFLIGALVTGALSATHYFTKDRIAAAEQEKIDNAMAELFPDATFTLIEEDPQQNLTLYTADGASNGYIVRSSAMGYKSEIEVLTAFGINNKIVGVAVTDCASESPGIGQKVGTDTTFLEQFKGTSEMDDIDAITGATYSCEGVKKAVALAVAYMEQHTLYQSPTDEEGGAL